MNDLGVVVQERAEVHNKAYFSLLSQDRKWGGIYLWDEIVEAALLVVIQERLGFVTIISNGLTPNCGKLDF